VTTAKIYDFKKGDPDEFYAPSHDSRGHGVRLSVTVPGTVSSLITQIVAKRYFPYRSVSHLIGNAVLRHLTWLDGKDRRMNEDVSWITAATEVIKDSEKMQGYYTFIGHFDRHIDSLKASGMLGDARRKALKVVNIIVAAPRGSWKTEALKHIHMKHGDLLRGGVSINPEEFEEE